MKRLLFLLLCGLTFACSSSGLSRQIGFAESQTRQMFQDMEAQGRILSPRTADKATTVYTSLEHMNFSEDKHPLADAASLAQASLHTPHQLWEIQTRTPGKISSGPFVKPGASGPTTITGCFFRHH